MPKHIRKFREDDKQVAIGLSVNSIFPKSNVNEEEARLESVKKIQGLKTTHGIFDEYKPVEATEEDGFRVQTVIERLNVRKTPDMKADILSVSMKGEVMLTESLSGEWLSVRTTGDNPVKGFVVAKFVKEVKDEQHT